MPEGFAPRPDADGWYEVLFYEKAGAGFYNDVDIIRALNQLGGVLTSMRTYQHTLLEEQRETNRLLRLLMDGLTRPPE